MVNTGATAEDVISGEPVKQSYIELQKEASSEGLTQMGKNPLAGIDFAKAEAMNNAAYMEKKYKGAKGKRIYELKKVFLRYAKKYALKWDAVINYPKQIKQKPAWFDLALSLFNEDEISSTDKKKIRLAFNILWDYRDRMEPERVMPEEESLRQYGITSPYYQQPEAEFGGLQPSEEIAPSDVLSITPEEYEPQVASTVERGISEMAPPQPSPAESALGVRKISPDENKDYLSGYVGGFKSNIVELTPFPTKKTGIAPHGEFAVGATGAIKSAGDASRGSAFNIGRSMFSSFSKGGVLREAATPPKPALPVQPVTTTPSEVTPITQPPTMLQRKKKISKPVAKRTVSAVAKGMAKFRNIELPTINPPKMLRAKSLHSTRIKRSKFEIPSIPNVNVMKSVVSKKQKPKGLKSLKSLPKIHSHYSPTKSGSIKSSATFDKRTIGNMSGKIRSDVGGIVGGIKELRKQVRSEFRDKEALKSLNLKNLKSNKVKTNKDLNVLNQLKSETRATMSKDALNCKMVPKLREQCDRVFRQNKLTGEVSKFRNEFKDISKTVPTVRGDRAKISEVNMLGSLVNKGVENAQVDDIKDMYKNSGSTKQMKIGMVEYDYSFATGKKKIKTPPIIEEEYYEMEDE